jgi:hypothetical protein
MVVVSGVGLLGFELGLETEEKELAHDGHGGQEERGGGGCLGKRNSGLGLGHVRGRERGTTAGAR